MALKRLTLVLQWENQNQFKMVEKGDDNATPPTVDKTIVLVEENSRIADVWPGVQNICISFLVGKMEDIGKEMKQP